MNAQDIFSQSELALAVYATLNNSALSAQKTSLKNAGLSDIQADTFASHYAVVTQYNDTVAEGGQGTSFSATVFKDVSGNLTLAMRGTAELFGTPNDLTTDSSISISGAGYDQIVAMYNWWMRESTPVGNTVLQYQIVPGPLDPHDGFQFGILWLQIMPPVAASGQLAAAIAADPDRKLDITGHSLSGHLGIAFGSLFAAATSRVTVFNAPGFTDTASNRNDVLEGGDGKDIINGDGLIEAVFMNSVADALHGADFVDGGATDVIAAHASHSGATGQFHCGNRRLFTDKTWRRRRSEQPCPAGRWVAAGESNCGSVACAA